MKTYLVEMDLDLFVTRALVRRGSISKTAQGDPRQSFRNNLNIPIMNFIKTFPI